MQIKKMEIKRYKGVQNLDVYPQKLNVITGKIGAGKSSILEAMRFGITGVSELDRGPAEVAVTLSNGMEIRRKITGRSKTVKVADRTTTQESVKRILEDATGVSMDSMKMITAGKLLANMNAGSLCEFLINSGLIPMTTDFDTVVSLCEIEPRLARVLSDYLPRMPHTFGLDEVQEAYQTVYDQRTALNREIALVAAQAAYDGEKPARSMEDVDNALTDILNADEKRRAYQVLLDSYEKAKAENKRIRENIDKVEEQIRSMSVTAPDSERKKNLLDTQRTLQERIASVSQTLSRIENSLSINRKMLDSLDVSVCPLHSKLVCHTDKTAIREDIENAIRELNDEQKKAAEHKNSLLVQSEQIQKELDAISKQEAEYEELRRLHETRKTLLASIPALPEKPVEPPMQADRSMEKAQLQAERRKIEAYIKSLTAKRKLTDLKRRLDLLDELKETLAPKSGLREKIIMSVLAPMEEHCNQLAEHLRLDFQISIQVKNGVSILCRPKATMDFVSLSSVSSGEQALAVFLILDMLNTLSGFGILVIDNLDSLDAKALDDLLLVLTREDVLDRYDHIFLAMVDHVDSLETLDKHCASIDQIIKL